MDDEAWEEAERCPQLFFVFPDNGVTFHSGTSAFLWSGLAERSVRAVCICSAESTNSHAAAFFKSLNWHSILTFLLHIY